MESSMQIEEIRATADALSTWAERQTSYVRDAADALIAELERSSPRPGILAARVNVLAHMARASR
jgi:hypothetical protein